MSSGPNNRLISETSVETLESQFKKLKKQPIFNYSHYNDLLEQVRENLAQDQPDSKTDQSQINWLKSQRTFLRELLSHKCKTFVEDFLTRELRIQRQRPVRDSIKQSFVFTVASKFMDEDSPNNAFPGKSAFFGANKSSAQNNRESQSNHPESIRKLEEPTFRENNLMFVTQPKKRTSQPVVRITEAVTRDSCEAIDPGSSLKMIQNSFDQNTLPEMFLFSSKPQSKRQSQTKETPHQPHFPKDLLSEQGTFHKKPSLSLSNGNFSVSNGVFPRTPQQSAKEKLFITWLVFERDHLSRDDLCEVTKGGLSWEFIRQVNWHGQKIMLEDFESRESGLIRSKGRNDKQVGLLRQKVEFAEEMKRDLEEKVQKLTKKNKRQQIKLDELCNRVRELRREKKQVGKRAEENGKDPETEKGGHRKQEEENDTLKQELVKVKKELERMQKNQRPKPRKDQELQHKLERLKAERCELMRTVELERRENMILQKELESKLEMLVETNQHHARKNESLIAESKQHRVRSNKKLTQLRFDLANVSTENSNLRKNVQALEMKIHEMNMSHDKVRAVMRNFRKGFHYYREKSNQRDRDGIRDPFFVPERVSHRDKVSDSEGHFGGADWSTRFFTLRSRDSSRKFESKEHSGYNKVLRKNRLIHQKGVKLSSLLGLDRLARVKQNDHFFSKLKMNNGLNNLGFGSKKRIVRFSGRERHSSQPDNQAFGMHESKLQKYIDVESKTDNAVIPDSSKYRHSRSSFNSPSVVSRSGQVKTETYGKCRFIENDRERGLITKGKSEYFDHTNYYEPDLADLNSDLKQFSNTLENNSKKFPINSFQVGQNQREKSSRFLKKHLSDGKSKNSQKSVQTHFDLQARAQLKNRVEVTKKAFYISPESDKILNREYFDSKFVLQSGSCRKTETQRNESLFEKKRNSNPPRRANYFLKNRHSVGSHSHLKFGMNPNRELVAKVNRSQEMVQNENKIRQLQGSVRSGKKSLFMSKKRRNLLQLVNTNQRRFISRMKKKYSSGVSGEFEISLNSRQFKKLGHIGNKNSLNIKFDIN